MASDGPSAGTATGGDGSPQDKPETSSGAPPSEAHAAGGTGGGEEGGDWHFIEIPTTESGGGTLRIAYLEAGRTAADADGSGDGASAGEGERPLVVCVHGYPDTARTWTDLLPRLAAAGFWAVAYNQRGYHPSGSPTDDDYDALRLGEDVLAVVNALGRRRAILIGHDWGASAVYNAAAMDPEVVERVVAIAIPHPSTIKFSFSGTWKARHFIAYKMPWAYKTVRSGGSFSHVRDIYKRWSPLWDPTDEELADVIRAFRQPMGVEHAIGYYKSLNPNPGERQKALWKARTHVPTLAIAGMADGATDPTAFDETQVQFKSYYRVLKMDGCGHFLHRERPDEFAAAVLEFLAAPIETLVAHDAGSGEAAGGAGGAGGASGDSSGTTTAETATTPAAADAAESGAAAAADEAGADSRA